MFKWSCFAVAVVFLAGVGWMVNDIRLEVRRTGELTRSTAATINQHLPTIMEKSKQTTEIVVEQLPELVGDIKTTARVLALLAEDISQVRQFVVGDGGSKRDENLLAYGQGVLKKIGASGGMIGQKNPLPSKKLIRSSSAEEWARSARWEVLYLAARGKDKKEIVTALSTTLFGKANWYIQLRGEKMVPLLDWLKANHPPTRELFSKAM
jgi:hypothetical protein